MNPKIFIYCLIFIIVILNYNKSVTEASPLTWQQTGTTNLKYSIVKANYYVSKTGSNNNNNTGKQSTPFLTIQKGLDYAMAGDTVFVQSGTYNEQVTVRGKSGTANTPTVISAYPGEHPIIDGTGLNINGDGALVMIWDSYIIVSGFEIRNSNKHGVITSKRGHNLITHNIIHDIMGQGIGLGGDYDIAEYNEVYNTAMSNFAKPGSGINAAGISARRAPNYAIIRHNTVHDVWGEGISTFEATNTIIEDNIAYDNWSAGIYISDATDVLLQRNFIYQTKNMDKTSQVSHGSQIGILLGDEKLIPKSANNTVVNNIVYGCKRNFVYWGSNGKSGMNNFLIANNTFINSTHSANIWLINNVTINSSFKNNIIYQDNVTEGKIPVYVSKFNSEMHFSNNLWSSTPNTLASGLNDIIGNAKFMNITKPYVAVSFVLKSSSPCIDNGINVGLTTDYLNNARIGLPDIGAIEYIGLNPSKTTYYNIKKSGNDLKIISSPVIGKSNIFLAYMR